MGGWGERIVPVLDHARREAWFKTLGRGVDLADHWIAPPPPHQPNHVCVYSCNEEWKGVASAHVARPDFFWVNQTCDLVMATAYWRALVISVVCTDVHLFLCNTLSKGVWLVSPWCWRYDTWCLMVSNAYALGYSVVTWSIDSPLNPLFWVVKRRLTKVVAAHSWGCHGCGWVFLIANE